MRSRFAARSRRSSFLGTALAGAATLASPALRLPSRAQTATLPAGRLALLAGDGLWLYDSDGFALDGRRRAAVGTGGWLQDPAWSPDGGRIAFAQVRYSIGAPGSILGGVPWPSADIMASPAASSSPADATVLVPREAPNETLVSPAWAPDGTALYAIRRRPIGPGGTTVATDLVRADLITGARAVLPLPGEPLELATGDDGALAVVTADPGGTGVTTNRLLRLAPPDYAPVELFTSDGALGFISYPRFSRGAGHILFAAGGGDIATAPATLFDTLLGRTASAHGARAWPHVFDLATGSLRRAPTEGLDDLLGLAWLDAQRALVVDAIGLGIAELDSGAVLRLPGLIGSGLSWAAV